MVKFSILNEEDKKLCHEESLKILEITGVRLESKIALDMLKSKGCIVDEAKSMVKFPRNLVEEAIKTAPRKFILGGLDPECDMYMGEGKSYITTDGQACFTYDYELGKRRESTMADMIGAAKITDSLDYIHCFWPIVTANDIPDEYRPIAEVARCYKVMRKHFQTDCYSAPQAKYYLKILDAILGSREAVIERKIFSVVCCPVSPLIFEPDMVEGCLVLADAEVPIEILPMPIAGTTAPMSLFSTVVQNNAEVLAGIAIFQLYKPGTPVIYGSAGGVLDMTTTAFCVGSPEGALQNGACAEMAKYYGIPSLISTCATEAKEPDIQCGREKAFNIAITMMLGSDLVCGVGLIDTANLYYPELLILDEDFIGNARRIADGMRGGIDNALTDVLMEVGPGGNFISEESTIKYLRNGEHYFPKVKQRQSYEAWSTEGETIRTYARKKAEEIINAPGKSYLSDEAVAKLEEILAEAEKELCN